MAIYDVEDKIRMLPYFSQNEHWWVNPEDAVRKEVGKTHLDPNKIVDGKFSYLSTKREVYNYYTHWMKITVTQLTYSVLGGIGAIIAGYFVLQGASVLFTLLAVFLAAYAGYKWRHAVGKYGNIKDFENMPVVLPIMDLYATGASVGMDLGTQYKGHPAAVRAARQQ